MLGIKKKSRTLVEYQMTGVGFAKKTTTKKQNHYTLVSL